MKIDSFTEFDILNDGGGGGGVGEGVCYGGEGGGGGGVDDVSTKNLVLLARSHSAVRHVPLLHCHSKEV